MKGPRTAGTLPSRLRKLIEAIWAVAAETRTWRAGLTGEGPATVRRQRAGVAETLAAVPMPARPPLPARGSGRRPEARPAGTAPRRPATRISLLRVAR
jgi:hypothetical protein